MTLISTPPGVRTGAPPDAGGAASRRSALLATCGEIAAGLEERLTEAGLEISRASAREAYAAAKETAPSVVLLAFGGGEDGGDLRTLARRLRAGAETLDLPLVFLFRADDEALRGAARRLGADDYFAQDAPPAEIRARLASLFWRGAAGLRAARAGEGFRGEADNFTFLLDAVSADARGGPAGSVALIEVGPGGAGTEEMAQALTAAHKFLRLNLRRADAVAFYGPATLVAYLPGADAPAARDTLSRLRAEFLAARPLIDFAAGVASFPAAGSAAEALLEKAGAALRRARGVDAPSRVLVYGEESLSPGGASEGAPPGAAAGDFMEGPAHASKRGGTAARRGARPGRRSSARRLTLVVSDAERMTQLNLLLRSADFEVRAAFDGQHALGLLRVDEPDVLLVDYALRDMDGVEMLGRLGRQAGGAPPAAVLLAPAGRAEIARRAAEVGVRAVLAAPFDPVKLIETLRAACDAEE